MTTLETIEQHLSKVQAPTERQEDFLLVKLPAGFGELEVGRLDETTWLIGLVDHDWYTLGHVLSELEEQKDEAKAIAAFFQRITQGELLLVEITDSDGTSDKFIADDRQAIESDLAPDETLKIYNA